MVVLRAASRSLMLAAMAVRNRPPAALVPRQPNVPARLVPARMCEAPAAPAAEAPAEETPPFALVDLRVGKILEAWEHPDSDKLWCEKIDVGEPEPREIASGLRAYYETADMLAGRSVLVVCNLKPAKLAGFNSNGMVPCASSENKESVVFVEPPEGALPGERVVCEGMEAPAATSNQMKKKKLMAKAAEELKAVDGVATYRGVPLSTAAGPCTSPGVASGTLS